MAKALVKAFSDDGCWPLCVDHTDLPTLHGIGHAVPEWNHACTTICERISDSSPIILYMG